MKVTRYWIPVLLGFATIFYLSSLPQDDLPAINIPHIDKIVHFLLYSALGLIVARALTASYRQHVEWLNFRRFILLSILIVCLYGAFDEWYQSSTPGRSVELADLVMDCLGAITGSFLVVPYRRWVLRIERS